MEETKISRNKLYSTQLYFFLAQITHFGVDSVT